jgi:hypothetical protein
MGQIFRVARFIQAIQQLHTTPSLVQPIGWKYRGSSVRHLFRVVPFILCLATRLTAQTISPVIVEYREKAAGRIQVHNDSDFPLTVVLEPRSFSADSNGKPTFRELSPEVHLELSTMSFRVGPKQDHYVFYKASADKLPSWFCVYASITGPHTQDGIQVRLELPHTVYLLGKKPGVAGDITWLQTNFTPGGEKSKIEAVVENRGSEVNRVREVEVTSSSGKQTYEGFPLFPGQQRNIELEWDRPGLPQHIKLRFERFNSEADLHESTR